MFATIEEAEKAAAMLRRFGNTDLWVIHAHNQAHALGIGHGETICDWEELADYLLARQDDPQGDQTDRRTRLLTEARTYLDLAIRRMALVPGTATGQVLGGAIATLDKILEALA